MKKNFLKISKFFISVSTLQVKRFLRAYTKQSDNQEEFLKDLKILEKNSKFFQERDSSDPPSQGPLLEVAISASNRYGG